MSWTGKASEAADIAEVIAAGAREAFGLGKWRVRVVFNRTRVTFSHPTRAFQVQEGFVFNVYLVAHLGGFPTATVEGFLLGLAMATPPCTVSNVLVFPKPSRTSWGVRSDHITVHSVNASPLDP